MKKGLYIAFEFEYKPDLFSGDNRTVDGIEKKIFYQYQTFEYYGYNMTFYNPYLGRKHSIERILRRLPLHFLIPWNFDFEIVKHLDFIYIRKMWFMDGDLILYLRKVKRLNPQIKILLEIPTYPYDKEGQKLNMLPLKLKDRIWRKKLKNYVDRIVTFSDDDNIFGIKTLKTSNAIDFETVKRQSINATMESINIIACGNLYYWHGFDRAIKGLAMYYENNPTQHINLYIVGNGSELKKYRDLVEENSLQKHVYLLGQKYGKELDDIYSICTVGLDSMGRHRSGIIFNSSLKGKEYAAKGLIIISGVNTEFDNENEYPYYYRIPANDEPIDFYKFVSYYNELLSRHPIDEVQKQIMSYAKEHFDFKIAMKCIIIYLDNGGA